MDKGGWIRQGHGAWVLHSQWVPRLNWATGCVPGLDLVDCSKSIDREIGKREGDDTCWARS